MAPINPREILNSYDEISVEVNVMELDIHMEYAGCGSHRIELHIKSNAGDLITLRDFIDNALNRKANEILLEREKTNASEPD